MVQALSNREIADQLAVSVETVRMHAKNIYAKLGVSGRQKASIKAIELGLVQLDSEDSQPPPNNLPTIPTEFIGRTKELQELHTIIDDGARLVTVMGTGGMGKTRLSLAYAHEHLRDYEDGVYFVPLDAVQTVDGIIHEIIDALPLTASSKNSYEQQLLDYLSDKQMLLVIDNWEHLLEGAELVSLIIRNAPHVYVIATSREKLSLLGETVYRLGGLSVPDVSEIDQMMTSEAMQLLRQTARMHLPNWDITEANVDAVQDLCHLTDGMPLGIILAVSWIDVYPLEDIIREIQKNVDFLQTDMRNVPERHQSIRSVFEWTWQLLSDDEQAVFMKVSVFRNGCTLSAIEAVTGATSQILQSLVSKALIYRNSVNRFNIHELLRQFADSKLTQNRELEQDTYKRHVHYYADIAEQIMTNQMVADVAEVELENLYVGWRWAVDNGNTELLWRFVNTYGIIAYQLGCLVDMKVLYDYALEQQAVLERDLVGSLLFVSASIHTYLQDFDTRDDFLEQAKAIFADRALTDLRLEAVYTHYHGALAIRAVSWDTSVNQLNEIINALEKATEQQGRVHQTMQVYAYSQLAYAMTRNPNYEPNTVNVKRPALKALKLAKQIDHKGMIGFIASILGERAFVIRQFEQAKHYFEEADEAFASLNSPYDYGAGLVFAGMNAYVQGDFDLTRRYLRRALDLLVGFGNSPSMTFIIQLVAHWKNRASYEMESMQLILYSHHHARDSYTQTYLTYFLGEYQPTLSPEDLKVAQERAQMMSYDMVMRELYAWLEE